MKTKSNLLWIYIIFHINNNLYIIASNIEHNILNDHEVDLNKESPNSSCWYQNNNKNSIESFDLLLSTYEPSSISGDVIKHSPKDSERSPTSLLNTPPNQLKRIDSFGNLDCPNIFTFIDSLEMDSQSINNEPIAETEYYSDVLSTVTHSIKDILPSSNATSSKMGKSKRWIDSAKIGIKVKLGLFANKNIDYFIDHSERENNIKFSKKKICMNESDRITLSRMYIRWLFGYDKDVYIVERGKITYYLDFKFSKTINLNEITQN